MIIATDTRSGKQFEIKRAKPVQKGGSYINAVCPEAIWIPLIDYPDKMRSLCVPLPDGSVPGQPAHVEVLYRKLGKALYDELGLDKYKGRVPGVMKRKDRPIDSPCLNLHHGAHLQAGYDMDCHWLCLTLASEAPPKPPVRFITIPGICDNAKMSEDTYQSIKKQLGKEGA